MAYFHYSIVSTHFVLGPVVTSKNKTYTKRQIIVIYPMAPFSKRVPVLSTRLLQFLNWFSMVLHPGKLIGQMIFQKIL